MPLPQRDHSRFNSTFRLKRKPNVTFRGFIGEAPSQVRGSDNPILLLEVGQGVQSLKGKLIEHITSRKTLYLVGHFLNLTKRINYRLYEITDYVLLTRDIVTIHPVTKQKVNSSKYTEKVWISEEPIESKIEYSENPVQRFNIRLDVQVYERDTIGNYLVRNVFKENGLWLAQCEYKVVSVVPDNSVLILQNDTPFEFQTGVTFQLMESN